MPRGFGDRNLVNVYGYSFGFEPSYSLGEPRVSPNIKCNLLPSLFLWLEKNIEASLRDRLVVNMSQKEITVSSKDNLLPHAIASREHQHQDYSRPICVRHPNTKQPLQGSTGIDRLKMFFLFVCGCRDFALQPPCTTKATEESHKGPLQYHGCRIYHKPGIVGRSEAQCEHGAGNQWSWKPEDAVEERIALQQARAGQ